MFKHIAHTHDRCLLAASPPFLDQVSDPPLFRQNREVGLPTHKSTAVTVKLPMCYGIRPQIPVTQTPLVPFPEAVHISCLTDSSNNKRFLFCPCNLKGFFHHFIKLVQYPLCSTVYASMSVSYHLHLGATERAYD